MSLWKKVEKHFAPSLGYGEDEYMGFWLAQLSE